MEQLPLWVPGPPEEGERVEAVRLDRSVVRIGTCGYSYRDWVGRFYPSSLKPAEMLDYYARRFETVEIDSSYYRVPSEATIASLQRRTPPDFRFTAKVPGSLTHIPADVATPSLDDAFTFRERLLPLVDSGKLGALLLQFPNSFRPGERADEHLRRLRDALPDVRLVAEFRHSEWQRPATLELLAELDMAWCNVDQPRFETLLRPGSDVVGDLAYVRMHGRNAKAWWTGDATTRYEYSYTPQELQPWVARVAEMAEAAKETYVFFNNHRFGHAASNAQVFAQMLRAL